MPKIVFDMNNYESFNDFNDLMIQAFKVGCSLCYVPQISFVLKNHPVEIGRLIHQQQKGLTDVEVDRLIKAPVEEWQTFEDKNFEEKKPTFLCEEC